MASLGRRSGEPEHEEAALGFPPRCVGQALLGRFVSSIRRADRESLSFRKQFITEILILLGLATMFFMAN
jgi:hypothetical protein